MSEERKKTRIAAIGDLHIVESDRGRGQWPNLFREISHEADVLLLCGDLTDTGDEVEAQILAEDLKSCSIPIIAVLGNHDYEKGRHKIIRQILHQSHIHVLDGESVIIGDVGFAGAKGFGGGLDDHMVSMFGESAMKAFVQEAVDEALRLDRALARLDQEHPGLKKVAVLHYSPISATLEGEDKAIFPFLGSSRLAEPLSRRHVLAAFHGHAHAGRLRGECANGVEVFNVARPVLFREGFSRGYFIYEV